MRLLLTVLVIVAGSARANPLTPILSEPIDQRVKEFRQLGPNVFERLSQTAFDPHEVLQTRWRAITTMGKLNPTHFRKELDHALTSPDWFMRDAGLIALLSDEHERAISWSERLLVDPALVVRTQAVRNLIALDARDSEALLWKEIFDPRNFKGHQSLWIRAHIAEALAKFAGPGRAKAFGRLLMERDARLYKWAINGLETSTGLRLSDKSEPVEIRRQKWLARLGVESI